MNKSTLLLTAICMLQSAMFFAQAGSLDITFDTDGKVTTPFGSSTDYGRSVAIQSDGKILVAGYSYNGTNNDFALARYNTTGSLDNTFDNDGKVTTDFGSSDNAGYSVVLQSDGKILVAGYSYNGADDDFAIARYTTTGSLDSTFDSDGKVTTAIGSSGDIGFSVVLQSDGKILVAGFSSNGGNNDFALARYNTDGSLDNTFSTDGKLTTAIGSSNDVSNSVVLQSDGKILVAGYSSIGGNNDFALARYTTTGSLDNTFSTDGKLTTAIGSVNDLGYSVVLQSDGKILVAGVSNNGANTDFALVRYTTTGSLDNTFDNDGKVTTDFGSSYDGGYSVVLQSDGKILVAGQSINGANADFALARYTTTGSLDNTFDTDGKLTTPIGSADDIGIAVALQSDGKILVAGWSNTGPNYDFAVARYNACAPITFTQSPTVCAGQSVTVGSNTYTISGTFTDILTAANTCDSIVVTNLTVNNVNTVITNSGNVITASATAASYQWLNCNTGNSVISGATAKSYTATVNGSYAVKVTQGGCSDTSACVNVNSLGVSPLSFGEGQGVRCYPNPTSGNFTLEIQNTSTITLCNIWGDVLLTETNVTDKNDIDISHLQNGIYILTLTDNNNNQFTAKIIKQ